MPMIVNGFMRRGLISATPRSDTLRLTDGLTLFHVSGSLVTVPV